MMISSGIHSKPASHGKCAMQGPVIRRGSHYSKHAALPKLSCKLRITCPLQRASHTIEGTPMIVGFADLKDSLVVTDLENRVLISLAD
jgi:hypothetical protein